MTELSKMPELPDPDTWRWPTAYNMVTKREGLFTEAQVLSIQAEAWNAAIEAAAKECESYFFRSVTHPDCASAIRTLRKETENHG